VRRLFQLFANRLPVRLGGFLLAVGEALGQRVVQRGQQLLLDAANRDADRRLLARKLRVAVALGKCDLRVARLTGSASAFGVQFDSLADVISFGMAPAILAFVVRVMCASGMGPSLSSRGVS